MQRRHDSYLAQAIATDIELYEQNLNATRGRVERAPDLVEFGPAESLLAGIHELMQQIVWWTSANAPKKAGKPKVTKLPRPKTAKQLYEADLSRKAFAHMQSVVKFVPQDVWERNIAAAQKQAAQQQQAGGD